MTGEKTYAENASFVQAMMQENLSHARHVENERMSLAMGMTGLVSGLWAVGGAAITEGIAGKKWGQIAAMMVICVIVFYALSIATELTKRWNGVFSEHWERAEECYKMLNDVQPADELFPFCYPRSEARGKTKQRFEKLYRILFFSMVILFCALFTSLCVIILPGIVPAG